LLGIAHCEVWWIKKHVTREQLASFCDPMNNLGQAGVMVDRVLASIKAPAWPFARGAATC
jgi:hypothetical protein